MFKIVGTENDGPVTVTARPGYDGDVIILFEATWGITEKDKSLDEAWDLYRRLVAKGYKNAIQ